MLITRGLGFMGILSGYSVIIFGPILHQHFNPVSRNT